MRLTVSLAGEIEGKDRSVPALGAEPPAGLLGIWSATRWHHIAIGRPDMAVDLVCELGGMVNLSLSWEMYVLAWEIPGRMAGSIGGTWSAHPGTLEFAAQQSNGKQAVEYHLNGGLLTITSESSSWDFENDGSEVATRFVGVFVKL